MSASRKHFFCFSHSVLSHLIHLIVWNEAWCLAFQNCHRRSCLCPIRTLDTFSFYWRERTIDKRFKFCCFGSIQFVDSMDSLKVFLGNLYLSVQGKFSCHHDGLTWAPHMCYYILCLSDVHVPCLGHYSIARKTNSLCIPRKVMLLTFKIFKYRI